MNDLKFCPKCGDGGNVDGHHVMSNMFQFYCLACGFRAVILTNDHVKESEKYAQIS